MNLSANRGITTSGGRDEAECVNRSSNIRSGPGDGVDAAGKGVGSGHADSADVRAWSQCRNGVSRGQPKDRGLSGSDAHSRAGRIHILRDQVFHHARARRKYGGVRGRAVIEDHQIVPVPQNLCSQQIGGSEVAVRLHGSRIVRHEDFSIALDRAGRIVDARDIAGGGSVAPIEVSIDALSVVHKCDSTGLNVGPGKVRLAGLGGKRRHCRRIHVHQSAKGILISRQVLEIIDRSALRAGRSRVAAIACAGGRHRC